MVELVCLLFSHMSIDLKESLMFTRVTGWANRPKVVARVVARKEL